MYKLTITVKVPYREGYNAINISAIPHYKTVTLLTAYADSERVVQQVADNFDYTRGQPTVSIEKVSYKPGLNAAFDAAGEWLKQNTNQGGE
tara:strand:- start:1502 stop:1774 length:273 start_codon:yes stop_codon:yes gene_type:complete